MTIRRDPRRQRAPILRTKEHTFRIYKLPQKKITGESPPARQLSFRQHSRAFFAMNDAAASGISGSDDLPYLHKP